MRTLLMMAIFAVLPAQAAVIHVAPGMPYSKPSEAALVAEDGDTVQIEPGDYAGDVAVWRQHNLTIIGVNGRPLIEAKGQAAESKGIWVIKGDDVIVDNIALAGARVADGNGAGIRFEGKNLTVRNSLFRDNENGILTGTNEQSRILVEHSEFDGNGAGDGYTHNIYVGRIAEFEMRYSYSHGADSGHQVKSRAMVNRILFNRLADESEGNSSYLIDLPNPGAALILGNELQQGQNAENRAMLRSVQQTRLIHNTFVNQRPGGVFLVLPGGDENSLVQNNVFAGGGDMQLGFAAFRGNHFSERFAGLVDAAGADFALESRSRAINQGATLDDQEIESLLQREYRHPMQSVDRCDDGSVDVGAHEYCSAE